MTNSPQEGPDFGPDMGMDYFIPPTPEQLNGIVAAIQQHLSPTECLERITTLTAMSWGALQLELHQTRYFNVPEDNQDDEDYMPTIEIIMGRAEAENEHVLETDDTLVVNMPLEDNPSWITTTINGIRLLPQEPAAIEISRTALRFASALTDYQRRLTSGEKAESQIIRLTRLQRHLVGWLEGVPILSIGGRSSSPQVKSLMEVINDNLSKTSFETAVLTVEQTPKPLIDDQGNKVRPIHQRYRFISETGVVIEREDWQIFIEKQKRIVTIDDLPFVLATITTLTIQKDQPPKVVSEELLAPGLASDASREQIDRAVTIINNRQAQAAANQAKNPKGPDAMAGDIKYFMARLAAAK